MLLDELLTKREAIYLLELIQECLACGSEDDMKKLLLGTKSIVDFDFGISALIKLDVDNCLASYQIVNLSYPQEWLDVYQTNELHKIDPVFKENFKSFIPQYWANTYKKIGCPDRFCSLASEFNLRHGYTSGLKHSSRNAGSLFSIAGKVNKNPRTEAILNILVPHLHEALCSITPPLAKLQLSLSCREQEVLNWIRHGKSTWDISVILSISERTVKFHVDNIMRKLGAVSRTHAVAIAVSVGLVDID